MPRDLDRDAVIYLTHRQWEGKRELDSLQLTTHGKLFMSMERTFGASLIKRAMSQD